MSTRIPRGPLGELDANVAAQGAKVRGKAGVKVGEKRVAVEQPEDPVRTVKDQEGWEEIAATTGLTVQSLLDTKMTGKSKTDFKGKLEQCMGYIKQLRACVRYLDTESQMLEADRDSVEASMGELQSERQSELEAAAAAAAAAAAELSAERARVQSAHEATAAVQEQLGAAQAELGQAKAELETALTRIAALEADVEKFHPQLEETQKQLSHMQEQYNKAQEYIANLQEYNAQKQRESIALNTEKTALQEEHKQLTAELAKLTGVNTVTQAQLESCQSALSISEKTQAAVQEDCTRLRADLSQVTGERDSLVAKLTELSVKMEEYDRTAGQTARNLQSMTVAKEQLEEKTSLQAVTIERMRGELESTKSQGAEARGQLTYLSDSKAQLEEKVAALQSELQGTRSKLYAHENHRRKLHNTIQEMKGNIRVFCRLRPAFPVEVEELDSGPSAVKPILDEESASGSGVELVMPGTEGKEGALHMFTFDRVFGPQATQDDVFGEISQLVQSALDGQKVCIFAYGQTGSGKTFTMLGDALHPGMIPRAMEQIFRSSADLQAQGWSFSMQASMMEIHNEEYKDLLGKGLPAGKFHKVVHDTDGNTTVSELTCVDVSHPERFDALMTKAMSQRSVGATALNERSSRSHCVFTLRIEGVCEATGDRAKGVLNLIDLAGSERLSKSLAQGERLKETQSINKSLSALGDVICAIGSKAEHVPFRNSKLTWYLQPCLGGGAKTLMFVNVAPNQDAANETLCSLRFATKVNSCDVAPVKRSRSGSTKI
eukprot:jgi/Tetstr1/442717/TSEL_030807.t1